MSRLAVVTAAVAFTIVLSGCGETDRGAPFSAEGGVAGGPTSGLWGDGSSGPMGMEVGCIRNRRLVILITVRNRTKRTVTLLGGGGAERPDVLERSAVQVRIAPPPPTGDAVGDPGTRAWSAQDSAPARIPAGRSAWVQSNFLMRNCSSLPADHGVTLNRSITLRYTSDGRRGNQRLSVPSARIVLTRGPDHPKLPINETG